MDKLDQKRQDGYEIKLDKEIKGLNAEIKLGALNPKAKKNAQSGS